MRVTTDTPGLLLTFPYDNTETIPHWESSDPSVAYISSIYEPDNGKAIVRFGRSGRAIIVATARVNDRPVRALISVSVYPGADSVLGLEAEILDDL